MAVSAGDRGRLSTLGDPLIAALLGSLAGTGEVVGYARQPISETP